MKEQGTAIAKLRGAEKDKVALRPEIAAGDRS